MFLGKIPYINEAIEQLGGSNSQHNTEEDEKAVPETKDAAPSNPTSQRSNGN